MGKLLVQMRKDLALAEDATATDALDHLARMFAEDMSDEEKKKAEDDAAAEEAKSKAEDEKKDEESKEMSEVRGLLKVVSTAPGALVTAVKALTASRDTVLSERGDLGKELAELRLSHKELSEAVVALRPAAEAATRLAAEAKATKKATFFDRQLHQGKLLPADRPFYEAQFELNEEAVVKHFESKPAQIKLGEWPAMDRTQDAPSAGDPREKLLAEAQKLAAEKKITLAEAVNLVTETNHELAESVGGMYGPAGIRR